MTNELPSDLKYTKTHEWVKIEEKTARVGITDHAQSELTDIVFAELPETGKEITKGDELCVVESVKSVSEIYAPVSGIITKINEKLEDSPETINSDPYTDGWLVEITLSKKDEVKELLDATEYEKLI